MDKISAKTVFVGKKSVFLPQCHSTNDIALEFIKNRTYTDGMIIYTDYQTAGRGQRGNVWVSEAGKNLMFSVILDCSFVAASNLFQLHQMVSLAIANTLKNYFRNVKIKWPNDIMVANQKICGILIENTMKGAYIEQTLIGVGLNVNQGHFLIPNTTSFHDLTGEDADRMQILGEILSALEENFFVLKSGKTEELKARYHEMLYQKDKAHTYEDAHGVFVGEVKGVNDLGQLVIHSGDQLNYYNFKEVKFLN